jgi:hypothetical protein
MFPVRTLFAVGLLPVLLLLGGCRKDDGRLKSYAVHGKVTVDGVPAKRVYVFLQPTKQPETHGIFPNAITNDQGEYWVSTYDSEDGAPLGEYKVTAKWPRGEGLNVSSDSPDRLNGRFSDPSKSAITFTVKEATRAQPNEVPTLELTTK